MKKVMAQDTPQFQLPDDSDDEGKNPAAAVARQKLDQLYDHEPDALKEVSEVDALAGHSKLSKHQAFIQQLTDSGRSLAEIQNEWHDYYSSLPDDQKHDVWREFYAAYGQSSHYDKAIHAPKSAAESIAVTEQPMGPKIIPKQAEPAESKTVAQVRQSINSRVQKRTSAKLSRRQHFQSLAFGLGLGAIVMLIFLFGFFNERFVAPFITPSKTVTNTPIISDSTTAVGPNPEIIIPKINVEIPVVYTLPTTNEDDIQKALEGGVVHYADTPQPGEIGNGVIVGHSSNNIFNKGKYKFAFVLLSRLEAGDTFMLLKDGTRYTYRVYSKEIVKPTDTGVLATQSKPSTFTLITCDPPGTSINRLVVVGEQISPDPAGNVASKNSSVVASTQTQVIPGNAPSLWSRLTGVFN